MPRDILDRQIHQLKDEVLLLGSMVEQALLSSLDALKRHDVVASQRIFAEDQAINGKRYAIENALLILIATQQPMAHDLRVLAAILEIITELERIGDYAKGIAGIVLMLDKDNVDVPKGDLKHMADLGLDM